MIIITVLQILSSVCIRWRSVILACMQNASSVFSSCLQQQVDLGALWHQVCLFHQLLSSSGSLPAVGTSVRGGGAVGVGGGVRGGGAVRGRSCRSGEEP